MEASLISRAARAYVLPMFCYLAGTWLAGQWPEHYALGYTAVVVLVGAITLALIRGSGVLRPHTRLGPGIGVGLIGIALWIGLSELRWEEQIAAWLPTFLQPGPRSAFDPWERLPSSARAVAFVGVRLVGLSLLVPVVEEIFWRGFLYRWIQDPDWESVPLGQWHAKAFWLVTLLFTLAHPEWFAAAVYGVLINALWVGKRDLWTCVVAHATSNLVLGLYILATGSWWLW